MTYTFTIQQDSYIQARIENMYSMLLSLTTVMSEQARESFEMGPVTRERVKSDMETVYSECSRILKLMEKVP